MKAGTVGIDLAKNVFQLHVSDKRGGKIFNKKVSRKDLVSTIDKLDKEEDFLVAMEACGGSTMSPGHSVPRDIKPESCLQMSGFHRKSIIDQAVKLGKINHKEQQKVIAWQQKT